MILVVGESLVDVVERADGTRTEHAGGSPANVAVGLGRLGLDVTLATSIGDDAHSELIESHLSDAGVALTAGSRTPGRTSSAVAHLGPDGAATYDFDVTWDPGPIETPGDVSAVHTGSIAATLAPGADDVETLVRQLQPTAVVTFDPNIRPALLPDRDEAIRRVDRLVGLADVVKVSDEDLRWLDPDQPVEAVAARWLDIGPSVVAVTRGTDGSTAFARTGRREVSRQSVTVVDTVGAGDAYMSGLIAGLHGEGLLTGAHRTELRDIDQETLGRVATMAATRAAWVVGRAGA
ncbi:MAG: carbohydrate kinase family protein [Aeromicrobium sp.]